MLSKKTILIVEDEPSILIALQRMLDLTGEFEAVTAQDGEAALQRLKTVHPDLIISDINTPNISGAELCRRVRENPVTKSIPFIFLSAKKEKLVEMVDEQVNELLVKPFAVEEVLSKIDALFHRIDQSEDIGKHSGSLEETSVEEVLHLCLGEMINGELVLQNGEKFGVIKLANGEITSATYNELDNDTSLDTMLEWRTGNYTIRPIEFSIIAKQNALEIKYNPNEAFQISKCVWWTGNVNTKKQIFHNVYMRKFGNDKKIVNTIIDPGPAEYFSAIDRKISSLVENVANLSMYILTDTGVDVCMNCLKLINENPKMICITSTQNWQEIRHYGIKPESVKQIDLLKNNELKLAGGQQLLFIPIPYMKSPGAFMVYDVEQRILFSGMLFSSYSGAIEKASFNFFATELDISLIRDFHKRNIPSYKILKNALEAVKSLVPQPEFIVPRYGKLLRTGMIDYFSDRLLELPVGVDIGE